MLSFRAPIEPVIRGADRAGDKDWGVFGDEAAGGQIGDDRVVEREAVVEVEAFDRFVVEYLRLAQSLCELSLVAARDFVLDQQRQEIGIGELAFDGLAVPRLERVENAGQAQLFEHGFELGHRVHRGSPW